MTITYTICTSGDVFEFLNSPTDERTTHAAQVNALIQECGQELESMLSRYIQPTTLSNQYLLNGSNCTIKGNVLYLDGKLMDTYEITAITEVTTLLSAASGYDQGDFIFDPAIKALIRLNNYWNTEPYAIKISLKTGINDSGSIRKDIKRILIEMASAKSGLWVSMVRTAEGEIQTVRGSIKDETKKLIKKLTFRSLV